MTSLNSRRRLAALVGALAIVYVVWGSTYLGIALAIETLPPLLMAATRFLIAGAVLFAFAGGFRARPGRRAWALTAITGALMLAGGNGGVVWAQQTVPSGIAALVIASVALWIALLDRIVFGQRLSALAVVGLVLGFVGLVVLIDPASPRGVDLVGATFLVLAALSWAIGTLVARRPAVGLPDSALVTASMQMLAGGVVLGVAGAAGGELSQVDLGGASWRSVGGLAYLVVFGSIVAFSAYAWLLRNARVTIVATYAYVNPIVAVVLGWAFLGEAIDARTLLAGAIVVAGVALIVSAPSVPRRARDRSSLAAARGTVDRSHGAAALRGK
jgi:drug/metabolite transporter (DMT)-like permease